MKTLILERPGHLSLGDTSSPSAPSAGEARVRVRRVGVCGTDLHAFRGRQPFFSYPRILGHELGVEVLDVGPDVQNVAQGDRCAVEPYLNCGRCIACRRGRTNCCVDLRVLGVHCDGGMRETILVPADKLHRSGTLTLDQLALVETLGIGAHAVQRAGVEPGETALVIGAGPIGLATTQFALRAGARVLAMDVNADRLAFSRDRLGVTEALSTTADPLEQLQALTAGDLPTLVFDATGNPESMTRAFQYVAHGGRLVFVGLCQADITFHDPHLHRRELTVFASRNSTAADFHRILAAMEAGEIDTTPWITHRAPLTETTVAFPEWLAPETGVVKAMIEV